jgi:hypothetical protein
MHHMSDINAPSGAAAAGPAAALVLPRPASCAASPLLMPLLIKHTYNK